MKSLRILLDKTLGALARHATYHVAHRMMHNKYVFELNVEPRVYAVKQGAVVVANHVHRDDGPLLIVLAWPWARLRPLAYHKEYWHWLQWPFMVTMGAVPGGDGTTHRGKAPQEIMSDLLRNEWGVLGFPGGGISEDGVTRVPPRISSFYTMLRENPGKPLIVVRTSGLHSNDIDHIDTASGKRIVRVTARVYWPDVSCTLEEFNARLERSINDGVPMPEPYDTILGV